jgi:phosphoglycolate phosphatase
MEKISVDLIVFDLDGTLADSLPDLAATANHVRRSLGLAPDLPADAVKHMIGGGENKFIENFLGPENLAHFEAALQGYFDYYSRHAGDLTRLYPGVRETLKFFAHTKLAVLSNKSQALTELVLKALGILPFFAAVRGGNPDLPLKPDPEPLKAIMAGLTAPPGRVLMVGDKPSDVLTGRGAGAWTAAVTYGYGDRDALMATAPDFLLDEITGLTGIIA